MGKKKWEKKSNELTHKEIDPFSPFMRERGTVKTTVMKKQTSYGITDITNNKNNNNNNNNHHHQPLDFLSFFFETSEERREK